MPLTSPARARDWWLVVLIVLIVVTAWLPWIFTPLMLDETGIVWIFSAGPGQIISRSLFFPQSTFYAFVLWATTSVLGTSEWALRLPSIVASVATLVLLTKLASESLGRSGRFLLPLLWLFLLNPYTLAIQARPYALAMCAGAVSLWALNRFLSQPSTWRLYRFAIFAAMPVYLSVLFVLSLAGYGLWLLSATWHRTVRVRDSLGVIGLWALMCLPLVPQVLSMGATSGLHTIPNFIRNREDLLLAFLPPAIVIGVLAALVLSMIRDEPPSAHRPHTQLLVAAGLVVVVSIVPLYFTTQLTPAKLWAPRYMSIAFAPMALVFAAILVRFASATTHAVAIAVPALWLYTPSLTNRSAKEAALASSYPHVVQALERERQATGGDVYVSSDFAEGWRWRFPVESADKEWLLAPYHYYGLAEPYAMLPHSLEQGDAEWRASFAKSLQMSRTLVVASREFPEWLKATCEQTHALRFVQKDPYFIAVLTRRDR